jgi:CHAD domain-containing protein
MAGKMDPFIRNFGAQIMLRQLQAMQAEADGVLQATDIECIHRMRVASRRLRAAQVLFDGFLPRRHTPDWEKLIKRVTQSLGQARDLDIQLETIQRFRLTVMDPQCTAGANRLYLRLLQSRSNAQKIVNRSVQKFETAGVLHYITPRLEKATRIEEENSRVSSAMFALADQSIRQRLDELLAYEEIVYLPEKVTELHAARIAAKRLRYTLEIFDPIYPESLKQWLKPVKEIQESLGLIHDCDVWIAFLPCFIDEERELTRSYFGHLRGFSKILPGIEVFTLNRGADRQRHYLQFLQTWKTAKRKRTWDKLREYVISNVPSAPDNQETQQNQPTKDLESTPEQITGETNENSTD